MRELMFLDVVKVVKDGWMEGEHDRNSVKIRRDVMRTRAFNLDFKI